MSKPKRFAEGTTVSVEKTKAELDGLLAKHGAGQRMFATDDAEHRAIVTFSINGRMVRLELRVDPEGLPRPEDRWASDAPRGWGSWPVQRRQVWCEERIAQRERESWRRLLLLTKAKLEVVAEGMSTFEREFLPDIVLPNGSTVHQLLAPQLNDAYATGDMPPLFPGGAS